ncbi:MAG: DUF6152 family protein [Rhodospirillaceae bacterium]|nr:DUF6152 family protein [Rhodospirillaceae bacterium]
MRWMLLLALMPLATHVGAHHSRAPFLLDETFRVEGTVVELAWRSPHVYMVVDVPGDDGTTMQWTFEGHSVAGLTRFGWQPDTFRTGDLVAVVANPNRDPSKPFGLLDNVTGVNGETYYSFRIPEEAGGNPPRQALTASTDFSGAWNRRGTLLQALVGGFGAPEGYPVNARGQALIDAYDPDDSPSFDCLPAGVPGITLGAYTHRWIREADRIVIEKDQSTAVRVIHLDGSSPPEDWEPNALGYSVGHFEAAGTLVVETTGFAPTRWGTARGLDSSAQKRVIERFRLADDGFGMEVSINVEDPEYLVAPYTREGGYNKVRDHEFSDVPCDLDTARRHLQFE